MYKKIWVSEEFWKKLQKEYQNFCKKYKKVTFIEFTKIYSKNYSKFQPVVIILKKKKKGYDFLDELEF